MDHMELCVDALVGPTHSYGGLGIGNVASRRSKGHASNPRSAALQCLDKAWMVSRLGVMQLVLPPQQRPDTQLLRRLGFRGSRTALVKAVREDTQLLASVFSSSSMWQANAATIVPSTDSQDLLCHVIPANLVANLHRQRESAWNARLLRLALSGRQFRHHAPLPPNPILGDEGAANHVRLSKGCGGPGIHVFVFGRDDSAGTPKGTASPRQSLRASAAVARIGGLNEENVLWAQQGPEAIAAGVFHNDVIATGHEDFLLVHEMAYASDTVLEELQRKCEGAGFSLKLFVVEDRELPLRDAVSTYLFNSQIVTDAGGKMRLLAPVECEQSERARLVIERLVDHPGCPLASVQYVDLSQSMMNGGGPACLRLRVQISEREREAIDSRFILDERLYQGLRDCVSSTYPTSLTMEDLLEAGFLANSESILKEISGVFGVSGLYKFHSR